MNKKLFSLVCASALCFSWQTTNAMECNGKGQMLIDTETYEKMLFIAKSSRCADQNIETTFPVDNRFVTVVQCGRYWFAVLTDPVTKEICFLKQALIPEY